MSTDVPSPIIDSPKRPDSVHHSVLHITHPGGHRASYRDLLAAELGLEALTGPASHYMRELLKARRVLFATLDGDIERFLLIAFLRSLLLRRTCGIFIGPLRYLDKPGSLRDRLRGVGLRIVKRLPRVEVFSVIPHPVRPQLGLVTSGWIHDPQLWDLKLGTNGLPQTELSRKVQHLKGQRRLIIYLGKASRRKGLPDLAHLTAGLEQEVLVVVAGQVLEDGKLAAQELIDRGMVVEDRFISDEELFSLYGVADYVWCVYPPSYDQASGVFGRAVQLGVVPLVRSGSVLDDYVRFMGTRAVSLADVNKMTPLGFRQVLLEEVTPEQSGAPCELSSAITIRAESIAELKRGLGG